MIWGDVKKSWKRRAKGEENKTLSLKERGGKMTVPFFWRTLPMLLPAVAANVKQIDSHIAPFPLSLLQNQSTIKPNLPFIYLFIFSFWRGYSSDSFIFCLKLLFFFFFFFKFSIFESGGVLFVTERSSDRCSWLGAKACKRYAVWARTFTTVRAVMQIYIINTDILNSKKKNRVNKASYKMY